MKHFLRVFLPLCLLLIGIAAFSACGGDDPDITTAPVTTAPVTTAPVTTAPVTTAPVTTAPVTTAPVTTAPVTTAPVTTALVTTAPVTTAAPVEPVGPTGVEIELSTLSLSGTDVSGSVSNTTATFSFIPEITVAEGATYKITTDVYGRDDVYSKTVPLSEGDNTFYILVENGNDIGFYIVTLRRRPMYTVTIDNADGTPLATQQVEEGSTASIITPSRTGYDFVSWSGDVVAPITDHITFTASWEAVAYDIIYTLNGGTNAIENPATYTIEDVVTLADPTRAGYRFLGWKLSEESANGIAPGSTGDKTFVAEWNPFFIVSGNMIAGVTKEGKTLKEITIPSVIDGVAITGIFQSAFFYCTMLESITIPEGVATIDDNAFSECTSLASVIFTGGSQLVSIGDYAFYDCTSLESIVIPDGVTSIGDSAFYDCTSLESIEIPDGVTSIGDYVFCYCTSLVSVTIPEGVTNLGYGVFAYTSLAELIIPDSVTTISSYAFYHCESLTSLTIPKGVNFIGEFTFEACTSLERITIPNSVTFIGEYAFSFCTSLESITIPDSVTTIGYGAFSDCTALTSVTIGNSVTSIGDYAFFGCTGLTSVTFENTTGWKAGSTSLTSTDLANPSTAATYLKNTYKAYTWTRN